MAAKIDLKNQNWVITEKLTVEQCEKLYILLRSRGFSINRPTGEHMHMSLYPHVAYSAEDKLVYRRNDTEAGTMHVYLTLKDVFKNIQKYEP